MAFFSPLSFTYKKIWSALAITSLGLGASISAVQAQEIDAINATFSVGYNTNTRSGNSRLTVQRHGQQYDAKFEAEHALMDITQQASFSMKQCQVRPQAYSNNANPAFKSRVKENISFNWDSKQANYTNSDEKKNKRFKLVPALYDPLSFFFAARCDLMAGKKRFTYPLIYKGDEREHTYVVTGTQVVKTGIGDVEALVVQRERSNKDRITRFYVAPSWDYMLVKIEHRESALAQASATLVSMDYKVSK